MGEEDRVNDESLRFQFTDFGGNERLCLNVAADGDYVLRKVHMRGESGYELARLVNGYDAADLFAKYIKRSLDHWCG